MECLVCENNSSGTSSLFWWQNVWEKYSRGLTSPDIVSEKITQEELSPMKRQNFVWRKYSEQSTEKQNSVKTCTSPQKRKHLPYMGGVAASTKKGKVVHIKQVWIGWNHLKAANCCSESSFFKKPFSTTATCFFQLSAHSTNVEILHQHLLPITFQSSTLSKLSNFSLCRKRCATTMKSKSLYDSTKLAIHSTLRPEDDLLSNWGQNFKKTVSLMALCTSLMRRTSWPM